MQGASERISHNPLLYYIRRVGRDPEDLRGQAASPEVDGGGGERGVGFQQAREDIVRAPPEEEEGAEEESSGEAVVETADAVGT